MLRKRTYIYTQFHAQNAGDSVSELPDFKFVWALPPELPSKRGFAAPCQYRRLLFSNWLATSFNPLHDDGDAAFHPSVDQKVGVLVPQELKLHSRLFTEERSNSSLASYSNAPDSSLICPGQRFRLKFSKSLRVFFTSKGSAPNFCFLSLWGPAILIFRGTS